MESDAVDRISALPDSVIHYIFSFLDARKLVQTSILSNRWRYLWTSTPYLNFHLQLHPADDFEFHSPSNAVISNQLNACIDFVDRVLILREVSSIHKFTLYCDEELDAGHLYTWIIAALARHVKELHIDISIDRPLELPHRLFTSNITTLEFCNHFFEVSIQMPQSMCSAARITSLELVGVKLPNGNLQGELTFSCPVLENLILSKCDHSHLKFLTISALLLKRLELRSQIWERMASCAINICSPNLTSFKLIGCMYRDCSLVNLSVLDSAHIVTYADARMKEEAYDNCLIKVLKGLTSVKSLTLSAAVIKTIADSPYMMNLLPNLFHNLMCMKLVDWTAALIGIQAVASFLERLSRIEMFVWSRSKEMALGSANEGDNHMNSNLKTIEIHNSLGSEDELELLKILLKESISLKQIIIMPSESLAQDGNKRAKFHEKLSRLPRASSSLLISFPLNN